MKFSPVVNDSGFPGPEKEDEIIHESSAKKYARSGGIVPLIYWTPSQGQIETHCDKIVCGAILKPLLSNGLKSHSRPCGDFLHVLCIKANL
jgi:hypothetical protein